MIQAKNQLKQEVRVWSLLGPMLITLIITLYLFRFSLYDALFPTLAVFGIFSIGRWRMYGLALSLFLLFSTLLYSFPSLAAGERFWSVGISMALGLAFVVLALCYEEVEVLLGGLEEEAGERFQKLTAVDTTLREKELSWNKEKGKLLHDMEWVREQSQQIEKKVQQKEDQLAALRLEKEREIEQVRELFEAAKKSEIEAKEQLTKELEAANRAEAHLKNELEAAKTAEVKLKQEIEQFAKERELPVQTAPVDSFKPRYLQLRDQFNEKSDLLDETRRELFRATEKSELLEREREEERRFAENEEATRLIRQILVMQKERDRLEKLLRSEICELESLVTCFISSPSKG